MLFYGRLATVCLSSRIGVWTIALLLTIMSFPASTWSQEAVKEGLDPQAMELLEKGLDRLDSLKGVLVVGDFPDVSAAVGGMLYAAQMPSSAALKALNERLSTWAKERDRVILFPLAELTCRLNDDQPLMIGDETWEGEAKGALLGADHLHPTIPGLIAIAHEVVHQIIRRHPAIPEERFVVGREAVRASLESILRSPEKKAS